MLFVTLVLFSLAVNVADTKQTGEAACSCSSGFIPIPVDVTIPVDPSNLNSTETFRLQTTFEVYGELCEPVSVDSKLNNAVQLLLHGQTYASQYWDIRWNGFQNYSYVALSCSKGITSFAYDNIGAGRTTRPKSSLDCQLPTASNVSSSLARGLKSGMVSRILTGREKKYEKVVAFGHSLGSATVNYAAIGDREHSPFDGLVLTGFIHVPQLLAVSPNAGTPATQVNPGRFPDLDPGYITSPNASDRMIFYGPTASSFSPAVFQLDFLTEDAGSMWITPRLAVAPAVGFTAPVAEVVGSFDQILCLPSGGPCDQASLQTSETNFFPDSRNYTMYVIDGFGHDLNLEFGATKTFSILNQLFENFIT